MKRSVSRFFAFAALAALLLLLPGCGAEELLTFDPQELYTLPTLPAEYTELSNQLNAILDGGAEYAAPTSGTNIQPVQMVDLDSDGREEAVAFFRNTAEEKSLKIYIFATRDDTYQQVGLIEGSGTNVYSVVYNDLDGDGRVEVVVGWKATAEQRVLEVYGLRPGGAEALLRTNYVKYTTVDLDRDRRQELVVLRADEQGEGVADYYNWQEDNLVTNSSARLSSTMAELNQQGRITKGTLRDGAPAIFVTGVTDMPRTITDILAAPNGTLSNIVLSETTGVSSEIAAFASLYPSDINSDGAVDVPRPVLLPTLTDEYGVYQQIEWFDYDVEGQPTLALRTYHNTEDGWYLQLPEAWSEGIYVSRTLTPDEAVVTFSLWTGEEEEPFLRIAAITGTSREMKAVRGERFLLARQAETIYTAELLEANDTWEHGINADEVRAAFNPILPEWAAGDN